MTEWVALWHVMVLRHSSPAACALSTGPAAWRCCRRWCPKKIFANAVAIGGTIWQLNSLVGPAFAGMLIYLIGIGPTYYFCFAASADRRCPLARHPPGATQPIATSAGGLMQHMAEGLNFIRKNEIYFIFIAMIFFNSAFGMSYLILMPVFARNVLDVGSQGFGFLQSAGGAGALAGVLAVAWFCSLPRQRRAGDHRRVGFRRPAHLVRALEVLPALIGRSLLARRRQPVLHDDDQHRPASQFARTNCAAASWASTVSHGS